MSARSEPVALAAEFPAATREQWRELVSAVLRKSGREALDADPEAALTSSTYDGIEIKPLYTADDALGVAHDGLPGLPPFVRGAHFGTARGGWDVRARHADSDAGRLNAAALADLNGGATSLWLTVGDGGIAVADLARALDGVHLDLAPIVLAAGTQVVAAADSLFAVADDRDLARDKLAGSLGADPIGVRARTGAEADLDALVTLADATGASAALAVATVDATVYHEAGGSDSDEVAIAAAVGVAYLRALTLGGVSVDDALDVLEFRYAVTADQFLSIAKLRAARRVWDRIADLSGAGAKRAGQRQHAVTSAAMMTRRDPSVNMLRTTIACFAAAIGGADAITVLPFDAALGRSDQFARRIARNTQSILHDESSLARVIDAAGGSWYIESLTDQLAETAWSKFTAIERAGGALRALDDGMIEAMLATARDARAADIAHRRAPITGVSEYAFPDEQAVVREPAPAQAGGGPLPPLRYAQDFEALRDRADAAANRPRVFLAALGTVTAHGPLVGFATNLFRAGGIEAVVGSGTPDDIVAEFEAARTNVVCLCASDKVYAESAEWVAKALRAAGAEQVWLAGHPGEREEAERASGIDGYVFAGCDALAVLRTALDTIGTAR